MDFSVVRYQQAVTLAEILCFACVYMLKKMFVSVAT